MGPEFQFKNYLLKRQVFALTGKFRIYGSQDQQRLFLGRERFRLIRG